MTVKNERCGGKLKNGVKRKAIFSQFKIKQKSIAEPESLDQLLGIPKALFILVWGPGTPLF